MDKRNVFEVWFPSKNWKLVRSLLEQMNYHPSTVLDPLIPHLPFFPPLNLGWIEMSPSELEPGQFPKVGGFAGRSAATSEIGAEPVGVKDYLYWSLPELLEAMTTNPNLKCEFGDTQATWRTIAVYLNTRIAVVAVSPTEEQIITTLIHADGGIEESELPTEGGFNETLDRSEALAFGFLAG